MKYFEEDRFSHLTEDTHPLWALVTTLSAAGEIWGLTHLIYSLIIENEMLVQTKITYLGQETVLRDILLDLMTQNHKLRELIVEIGKYKSAYLAKHPDDFT